MSDNWMHLIPEDPLSVIPPERLEDVRSVAAALAPAADDITVSNHDRVVFVDAGGNFEAIHCPSCRDRLEPDWWTSAMAAAFEKGFGDLRVRVPCCGVETTLHDLEYDWPQGFGRSQISIFNPSREQLTLSELNRLAAAAGTELRVIWQHI